MIIIKGFSFSEIKNKFIVKVTIENTNIKKTSVLTFSCNDKFNMSLIKTLINYRTKCPIDQIKLSNKLNFDIINKML